MTARSKSLSTSSVVFLVGLALIPIFARYPSDHLVSSQQGQAELVPEIGQTTSRPGSGLPNPMKTTTSGAGAFARKNDRNSKMVNSEAILDDPLTGTEQKSLWHAFSEARREVREIPEAWAGRGENIGYDFYALHPKQNLTTRFGSGGVQLVSSDRTYTETDGGKPRTAWEAGMRLQTFAGLKVAAFASPQKVAGNRVEYQRAAGLIEWYHNGLEAMEHGFTVAARPGHLDDSEEVVLKMRLEGLSAAVRDADGQSLVFRRGEREVLAYEKLKVFDAGGKELPARMEPTEDGFLLAYHDAGGSYPVTVDPLIVNEEAGLLLDSPAEVGKVVSVSVSGDTVVVGVPEDDDSGIDSGSVYVFTRHGGIWSQQDKVTADDATAEDQLGYSVSVSGDTMVAGISNYPIGSSNSGSVYVFKRSGDTWNQQAKLTPLNAAVAYRFHVFSVSVSGDTVVVGARGTVNGMSVGKVYVFTRSGNSWSQQAELTAPDATEYDSFGYSVSISSDTLVVHAIESNPHTSPGCAFVYTRSGRIWSLQQKLTADDEVSLKSFGSSVSVSGDTVVVGAIGYVDGVSSGHAYVFTRSGDTWSQQAKLTTGAPAEFSHWGPFVSVSGDLAVLGANGVNGDGNPSATAHVFKRSSSTWSEQAELTPGTAAANEWYSRSVSASGNTVVIGTYLGGIDDAKAHVYRLAVSGVPQLQVMDHLSNQVITGGVAFPFDGQLSETSKDYVFTLTNAGEFGLDLQSISLIGEDAGQFSLGVGDLSTNPDLEQGESMTISVSFHPVGGSGPRTASLRINSDDPATPFYTVNLSGLGLSKSEDEDADGMNDWAEYELRGFGFDWETPQSNLVSDFYEKVPSAGLVTLDEVAGLKVGAILQDVNQATNRAKFTIELQQSDDLVSPFIPIDAVPARLSIDAQGRIIYEVEAQDGKRFYLLDVGP